MREGTAQAGTVKLAKQKAAVELLAAVHGLKVEWPASEAVPEAPKAVPEYVPDSGKNPISTLMEMSQASGKPAPQFSFRTVGPSNAPTVTCFVEGFGHRAEAKASRKQDAKALAAKALLEKL